MCIIQPHRDSLPQLYCHIRSHCGCDSVALYFRAFNKPVFLSLNSDDSALCNKTWWTVSLPVVDTMQKQCHIITKQQMLFIWVRRREFQTQCLLYPPPCV